MRASDLRPPQFEAYLSSSGWTQIGRWKDFEAYWVDEGGNEVVIPYDFDGDLYPRKVRTLTAALAKHQNTRPAKLIREIANIEYYKIFAEWKGPLRKVTSSAGILRVLDILLTILDEMRRTVSLERLSRSLKNDASYYLDGDDKFIVILPMWASDQQQFTSIARRFCEIISTRRTIEFSFSKRSAFQRLVEFSDLLANPLSLRFFGPGASGYSNLIASTALTAEAIKDPLTGLDNVAALTLPERPSEAIEQIDGSVISLRQRPSSSRGQASILFDWAGRTRSVTVRLSRSQYRVAAEAHLHQKKVRVNGLVELTRTGRWLIYYPRSIEIL